MISFRFRFDVERDARSLLAIVYATDNFRTANGGVEEEKCKRRQVKFAESDKEGAKKL